MNCPIDSTPLVMSERQGIEIDYCPSCRGVWLDRGELDKVIERSNTAHQPRLATQHEAPVAPSAHYDHSDSYKHQQPNQYRHKKKRESFLGDLFDF